MRGFTLILAAGLAMMASPVRAQDLRAIQERLNDLDQQVLTLSRDLYSRNPGGANAQPTIRTAADVEVRLQQMESQLRDLTGQIERQQYQLGQITQRLDKLVADVDFRLRRLEGAAPAAAPDAMAPAPDSAAAAPGLFTQPAPAAPADNGLLGTLPATAPAASADAEYDTAFGLLRRKDYAGAEKAFTAFLSAHPGHRLAGNARYWLGETYYVRQDMNNAALAFAEGYKADPKGPKAPDNLLKLGLALGSLGKTDKACLSLRQIGKDFADAPETLRTRATQAIDELHCP